MARHSRGTKVGCRPTDAHMPTQQRAAVGVRGQLRPRQRCPTGLGSNYRPPRSWEGQLPPHRFVVGFIHPISGAWYAMQRCQVCMRTGLARGFGMDCLSRECPRPCTVAHRRARSFLTSWEHTQCAATVSPFAHVLYMYRIVYIAAAMVAGGHTHT